jgi:hypothetical protein
MLVSHPDDEADALLDVFGHCDSNTVSAWIVSKMDAASLASHLCHAAFCYAPDKVRYLLRWYDPLTMSTLLRLADREWVKWFLAPMNSFWYPVDTPQKETWSRVEGGGDFEAATSPVSLHCGEELWEAFVNDPLPYHLLNTIEESNPSVFKESCYGVRLAKIEEMLAAGKQQGLRSKDDLAVYVWSLLEDPSRAQENRWQMAVKQAAKGQRSLSAYFS